MVKPELGILMPTSLELEVGVLATFRSNFWEPLGFYVAKFLLIHPSLIELDAFVVDIKTQYKELW